MLQLQYISFCYPYSAGNDCAGPDGLPLAAGGGVVVIVGGAPNAGAGVDPNAELGYELRNGRRI